MQFKCEIWGLKRRFSISLLRATDIIQNSLVISLHSTLTHDMMASNEVMDKIKYMKRSWNCVLRPSQNHERHQFYDVMK